MLKKLLKGYMYASYLKEREGVEYIETDKGFAVYSIQGQECYIRDIYVLPEYRQQHVATELADQITNIAKEQGCHTLYGSVAPQAKDATKSLKILLQYGMELRSASQQLIVFIKEIGK